MSAPIHLAVLGDPIDHSRSPAIHTAALSAAGVEGDYVAIRADRRRLEQAIDDLRRGRLHGLNITMPLKGDAWALAEWTTTEGDMSSSINTLRYRQGRVEGHSSDVVAFREILESGPFSGFGVVHLLGAGGSARAVLGAVTDHEVYVSARSEAKAVALTERFDRGSVIPWGTPVAGAVVVNATPLGMRGENLPSGIVEVSAGLVDLPYGHDMTPAVAESAARGRATVDGFEFLARQAGESFNWWTGISVDLEVLIGAARNA